MVIQKSTQVEIFIIYTVIWESLELQLTLIIQFRDPYILVNSKKMIQIISIYSMHISLVGKILFLNAMEELDINMIHVSFAAVGFYHLLLGEK